MSNIDDINTRMEQDIQNLALTAPRVSKAHIDALMAQVEYKVNVVEGTTTTMAVAVLNGFTLAIGQSACLDPANFNEAFGHTYAIEEAKLRAENELWRLEGYRHKFHALSLAESF